MALQRQCLMTIVAFSPERHRTLGSSNTPARIECINMRGTPSASTRTTAAPADCSIAEDMAVDVQVSGYPSVLRPKPEPLAQIPMSRPRTRSFDAMEAAKEKPAAHVSEDGVDKKKKKRKAAEDVDRDDAVEAVAAALSGRPGDDSEGKAKREKKEKKDKKERVSLTCCVVPAHALGWCAMGLMPGRSWPWRRQCCALALPCCHALSCLTSHVAEGEEGEKGKSRRQR